MWVLGAQSPVPSSAASQEQDARDQSRPSDTGWSVTHVDVNTVPAASSCLLSPFLGVDWLGTRQVTSLPFSLQLQKALGLTFTPFCWLSGALHSDFPMSRAAGQICLSFQAPDAES